MFNSRQLSIEAVSIKNYKIQISRFVFHAYPSYLCRVSFLTILDIYKDYFKDRLTGCKVMQRLLQLLLHSNCDWRQFALIHISLVEAATFVSQEFCNQGAS